MRSTSFAALVVGAFANHRAEACSRFPPVPLDHCQVTTWTAEGETGRVERYCDGRACRSSVFATASAEASWGFTPREDEFEVVPLAHGRAVLEGFELITPLAHLHPRSALTALERQRFDAHLSALCGRVVDVNGSGMARSGTHHATCTPDRPRSHRSQAGDVPRTSGMSSSLAHAALFVDRARPHRPIRASRCRDLLASRLVQRRVDPNAAGCLKHTVRTPSRQPAR
jgi:hypothetical protein